MNSDSHIPEQQRFSWDWLRWIAVLPAAVGSYWAILFAVVLFAGGPSDHLGYKPELICSIIGPYLLVCAGAKTAPRFRFVTALTLTVLYAIAHGSFVTLSIVRGRYESFSWLIINFVVGIVATVVACIQMRKKQDAT